MNRPNLIRGTLISLAVALFAGCSGPQERTVTFIFSNNMEGEIRSCGCAAKDYGGLGRRATFIEHQRHSSPDVLLLEAGDFFGTNVNYGREKADLTLQSMSYMRYDGIVLGEEDFSLGFDFILERVRTLKLPVVGTNIVDPQTGEPLFPRTRIVHLENGLRVGLLGVISPGLGVHQYVEKERMRLENPRKAIERELDGLRDNVDMIVVLAHMTTSKVTRLAGELPDVAVVAAGHEGRPMRKLRQFGNAYVLQCSSRGQYIGVSRATIGRDGAITQISADLLPLTPEYADHDAIIKLFHTYDMEVADKERDRVKRLNTAERAKQSLTGPDACEPCHQEIHAQWQGTAHAHAFDILREHNREYDRDCTPCHVTGFYELGGFASVDETPALLHVTCESCHGSGNRHVADPHVRTPGDARSVCVTCHTQEQTPEFTFDAFWKRIEH